MFSKIAITDNFLDCWLWTGKRNRGGYGRVVIDGHDKMATRLFWELMVGPIPKGMDVCHRCDNPPCCNLLHLFLGTRTDNMHDASIKGRISHGARQWRAKLTDAAVREIRAMAGTHDEIAARFGVERTVITNIKNRKRWRHVN